MTNNPQMRSKISESLRGNKCGLGNKSRKGQKRSSAEIQKQLDSRKVNYPSGFHHSEETKLRIAIGHIGIQSCLGKQNALGYRHTPEMKSYFSENRKGHLVSKETRAKIAVGNKGKIRSGEEKEKIRHSLLTNRDRLVAMGKKAWEDPTKVTIMLANMLKARRRSPNKLEEYIQTFLNSHFPGEWRYVGNGSFIIDGKCPDFVNINGRKLIIEIFGDYWHQGEDGQSRMKTFESYGYQTLILWESEIKCMTEKEMIERIGQFSGYVG